MFRTPVVATTQALTNAQPPSSQGSATAGREGQPAAGRGRGLAFTEPSPLDFGDHEGYVSIFDGRTLDGWDGNPKFWRVEDGAIVGESTPDRPSGNSYIAYRRMEAKDFTLKFEIKVEGTGGSGLQYRSRTGLPWLANIPANVTAFNVGPVNLELDDDRAAGRLLAESRLTGQFYSENTPMRILAWRGQVVEGFGDKSKRLMGTIGDRTALGDYRQGRRLEPVHRDRARRHLPAYPQRATDGRHDRRRSRLSRTTGRVNSASKSKRRPESLLETSGSRSCADSPRLQNYAAAGRYAQKKPQRTLRSQENNVLCVLCVLRGFFLVVSPGR